MAVEGPNPKPNPNGVRQLREELHMDSVKYARRVELPEVHTAAYSCDDSRWLVDGV